MDWPTIIVATIIAVILTSIIVCGFINKKKGKSTCSCGRSCGACQLNCHGTKEQ